MNYREIPADKILRFPSTAGFKGWKQFFSDESIAHPAKMNLNLLRHILKEHTRPGDVVLDPMAGTGSTVILAAMLGRHGVAVEYEPHFCDMIRENIKRTEKQTTLTSKGSAIYIQGDARELSKLLNESDVIVTSPPYAEMNQDKRPFGGIKDTTANKRGMIGKGQGVQYGEKEDNVGSLPYGDIGVIITSPPYADSVKRGDEGPNASGNDSLTYDERLEQPKVYSNDPENIGNLKSESYLEAMLQCYREFFKVLKEGGIMVLATKNFIREKVVIRLDLETIRLAETVGFTLKDRWYFRLPTRSFWRILYHQKYPGVPEIDFEDVLIFEKEAEK